MLTNSKYFAVLTIALTIICYNETKRIGKTVFFLSTHVSFNKFYIQEHTLRIGPERKSLNITLNILRDYTHDPWEEIILSTKMRKNNTYRSLFIYDVNICNFLGKEGSQLNNFISGWINNFLKYGNLPKSCPILRGNYSWHGLKAEKLNIPPFLPNGKYRIIVNTYFRKSELRESVANLTVLLELK